MMYAVPLNVWNGNAYSVVLGDFNNDGSLDMAVANSGRTGTVTVILSNPVAVFSAAKLVFGKVTTGSSSTLELTVTDQSPTKLTIKGITISGKGASEYSQTNRCGTVVTPYGSCTVTVRFSPSAIGTQNALLNFAASAAGKTRTISLVGTGQ